MMCFKCGRKPIENNLSMFPIDKKGTKNRRWVCNECISNKEKQNIKKQTIDFIKTIGVDV